MAMITHACPPEAGLSRRRELFPLFKSKFLLPTITLPLLRATRNNLWLLKGSLSSGKLVSIREKSMNSDSKSSN